MLSSLLSKYKVNTTCTSRKETRNRLQIPKYADTKSNENIFYAKKRWGKTGWSVTWKLEKLKSTDSMFNFFLLSDTNSVQSKLLAVHLDTDVDHLQYTVIMTQYSRDLVSLNSMQPLRQKRTNPLMVIFVLATHLKEFNSTANCTEWIYVHIDHHYLIKRLIPTNDCAVSRRGKKLNHKCAFPESC